MIDSVKVDGFRGIKRSEKPVSLSEFNILIGRNNSGKTSVLEALYSVFGGNDAITNRSRRGSIQNLHSNKNLVYRYSGNGTIRIMKDGTEYNQDVNARVESNNMIGSTNDVIYYPPSFKALDSIYDGLQKRRNEIEKDAIHVKVTELLNEYIDDRYTEIYLETLEMRKKPPNDTQYHIDIKDLGDGILRAIPVYLMMEVIEPELFLWDDITTSLHPGLTRGLLEWLAEKDTQFVGATHSIDLLSALIDIQPDVEVSIIQLSKSADDILSHETLDLEELELIMENAGHDPRFIDEIR